MSHERFAVKFFFESRAYRFHLAQDIVDGPKRPPMVWGGPEISERFEMLAPHYPQLRLLEPDDIARIEPAVAYSNGGVRADEIIALGSEN